MAASRLLAGTAFVVSLGLAGGAAYALDQATGKEPTPTALTQPTATPTPEPTPSATPSPTPSPTASPTPSPTPSRTPSPTPKPTVTQSPVATRYPYPKPTTTYAGLSMDAAAKQSAYGQKSVGLGITGDDGDGKIFLIVIDWGDGTTSGAQQDPTACKAYPSPTARPGPYRPQPDHFRLVTTHTYPEFGLYNITVRLRSVNADCRPYGPKTENQTVTLDGVVVGGP